MSTVWIAIQALGNSPEEWGYKGFSFYGVFATEQLAVEACLVHRTTYPALFVFPMPMNSTAPLETMVAPGGYYPSQVIL